MCPCSITFQYMYGLGTGQSCGAYVSNTKIIDVVFPTMQCSLLSHKINDFGVADRCSTVTLVHNSTQYSKLS